jgi:hypothetical protein
VVRLLFDDRLAPITSDIGFIEIDAHTVVGAYIGWQRGLVSQTKRLDAREIRGDLEAALRALPPLRDTSHSRELFVPTASAWTAYFDNGWDGPDPFPPMSYLASELGCRAMRVAAVPNTIDDKRRRGRYGASILELYGPTETEFLNHERSIAAANDGGRWVFETFGDPLPFEDTTRYAVRRKRDRFPFELLDEYLQQLGVRAFDETFYAPDRRATLVERTLTWRARGKEYTLEAARARF